MSSNDKIDGEAVVTVYEEVRDDKSETSWLTLRYDDKRIVVDSSGSDYSEFVERLADDERVFGYIRIMTGDEMSKRAKFAFITWAGPSVSAIKKAKLTEGKPLVKNIIKSFAIEIHATEKSEVEHDKVKAELIRAGGANYGTGQAK